MDNLRRVAGPDGLEAWIESRDEVASLFIASRGRMLVERCLALGDRSDFWYEGCDVQHLSWHGRRVVVVSRERGCYLRAVDPDRSAEEGMPLADGWRIEGDLVLWPGGDPGLVCAAALPSLDARLPLPFRGATVSGDIRIGARQDGRVDILAAVGSAPIDTLALPTNAQQADYGAAAGLFDAVERRLFPAGASLAGRLVIEAVALPFVAAAPWRRRWQPSPVWMPVYWHRHLVYRERLREAGELVDLLDAIAHPLPEAEPEYGWDSEWNAVEGQIELAVHHVRRRARVIARACRSGDLPPGWRCLLFDPMPGSEEPGSRVEPGVFPAVLRQVFEELVATGPERLTLR